MLAVEVFFATLIGGMVTVYASTKKSEEIVLIRKGSEITQDEYYCHLHQKWNWVGDECHCCSDEEDVR